MRLDIYLTQKYKNFSRGFIQKFIRDKGVKINGKLVTKNNFDVGESEIIEIPEKDFTAFLRSKTACTDKFPFDKKQIIFEERDFFAVDKPPFITTEEITGGFFPVHRLDRDTSGVLVIAKNIVAQAALQAQWRNRLIKKTYIALVKGILEPKKGGISAGIFRSMKNRRRMAVSSSSSSRDSYTGYEVKKYFKDGAGATLLYAYPLTGRTHQIRVHFASISYPIIGDSIYGNKQFNKQFEENFGLERQFLHAAELKLKHPVTGKNLILKSRLPDDLEDVLEKLRNKVIKL